MPFRVLVISLLILLVACDIARASDDELRQKRALLVLEDFRQWVDAKYQFIDQKYPDFSSSSHEFQESYNANLDTSILNSHFFNTSLLFSVGSDQSIYNNAGERSSRSDAFRYNYQFSGSGLDRSITPFNINSYRHTETVTSPFSPAYTSNTTGNEFKATLRNTFLPITVNFSRRTADNTGGSFDSSTVSDSFSLLGSHQYKDLSGTSFALTASHTTGNSVGGSSENARSYSASLSNNLRWGSGLKYSLSSVGQIYDNFDQNTPQRNVSLTETFTDHLGKALDLQASYSYSGNSSDNPSQVLTQTSVNMGEVIITHRLFDSVTTRLRGKYSDNELLNGSEIRYSAGGEVNYVKKLPGANHLTIATSALHEVIDNHVGSATISFHDIPLTGVKPGDILPLKITNGVLKTVTSVRSLDPVYTFQEGVDYTVDYVQGQLIFQQDGMIGRFPQGIDLLVSYNTFIDPILKYASDSYNINGGLTFQGGRYSIGAAYNSQWTTLLSGPSENSLRDSSSKMVYFNGNAEALTYRVSFTDSEMGSFSTRYLDSSGQYIKDLVIGRFAFSGTERYTWYSSNGTTPAYGENTTSLAASGVRNLTSRLRLTVSGNLYDSRSDAKSPKDMASLRANLLFVLNKTMITMDGQTSWSFSAGSVTRNDNVSIDFSRQF